MLLLVPVLAIGLPIGMVVYANWRATTGIHTVESFARNPKPLVKMIGAELGDDVSVHGIYISKYGNGIEIYDGSRLYHHKFSYEFHGRDRRDGVGDCSIPLDEIDFSVVPDIVRDARSEVDDDLELQHIHLTCNPADDELHWQVMFDGSRKHLAYDLEGDRR